MKVFPHPTFAVTKDGCETKRTLSFGQVLMKDFLEQLLFVVITPVVMCFGHWTCQGTGLMRPEVTEKDNCIEITGRTGASGAAISRVTVKRHRHEMIVEIHMVLCGIPHPLAPRRKSVGVTTSGLNHYQVPITPCVAWRRA